MTVVNLNAKKKLTLDDLYTELQRLEGAEEVTFPADMAREILNLAVEGLKKTSGDIG